MLWLPDAVRDPHGRVLHWTETTDPKGCLHTTEGIGWPTYQGWTVNPHGTVRPVPGRGVEIRQHVPFDQASFALRHIGAQPTNTDFVFQWELIGSCDPLNRGKPGFYYWPDADDAVLHDLYMKLIKPLSDAYKIPLKTPTWLRYPASAGDSPVRMSDKTFDKYSGWLGHQHVPKNTHGDPGAFPWARMMSLVSGGGTVSTGTDVWNYDLLNRTTTAPADVEHAGDALSWARRHAWMAVPSTLLPWMSEHAEGTAKALGWDTSKGIALGQLHEQTWDRVISHLPPDLSTPAFRGTVIGQTLVGVQALTEQVQAQSALINGQAAAIRDLSGQIADLKAMIAAIGAAPGGAATPADVKEQTKAAMVEVFHSVPPA